MIKNPANRLRLLLICDPTVYPQKIAETPELYQNFTADDRFEVYHTDPKWILQSDASIDSDGFSLNIQATKVPNSLSYQQFLDLSESKDVQQIPIQELDLAFCRTLKPFPDKYMDVLVKLENYLTFVNSPIGIQRHLEPSFLPSIAHDFISETIVTSEVSQAVSFFEKQNKLVAKKPNSCGGKGVTRIERSQDGMIVTDNLISGKKVFSNPEEAISFVFEKNNESYQLVSFLENSWKGDKRVLVTDGQIYGSYLRKGQEGSWIHNVSNGGHYRLADVTDYEKFAIRVTSDAYRQMGVLTLGYDFLADKNDQWQISEINAGNIAGYILLEELTQTPIYNTLKNQIWQFGVSNRKGNLPPNRSGERIS